MVEVGGEHARGGCLRENMRGVGASSNGAGAGSGSPPRAAVSRADPRTRRRGDVRGPPVGVVRGGVAAGTAAASDARGSETRRDVGEERGETWGRRARAGRASARRAMVARASSSAIRRRLALASEGTGALVTLRRRGGRRAGRRRGGARVNRSTDARVARVSVVGVCRGGRSVGGIGERASQRRGRSKHAGARGTTSDAGRTEAVGAGAASDAARVDRRGDVRVGVGLTIASDDADSRERVSRSARRIRPCPPTIARGGEGILGRLDRKGDGLFLESRGTN